MDLKLYVPGVDDEDEKGKVNAIKGMFTNVSAGIPSLIFVELPAYLPAHASLSLGDLYWAQES